MAYAAGALAVPEARPRELVADASNDAVLPRARSPVPPAAASNRCPACYVPPRRRGAGQGLDARHPRARAERPRASRCSSSTPVGTALESQWVDAEKGSVDHTFHLDEKVPGGSWSVQLVARRRVDGGAAFTVASFEAPRVKKTLEFAPTGYEARRRGLRRDHPRALDRREARQTSPHPARVQADGVALPADGAPGPTHRGEATVAFALPARACGARERDPHRVGRRRRCHRVDLPPGPGGAPDDVHLAFFPEGGELVVGLPSRVVLRGDRRAREPADVTGEVVRRPRARDRGDRVVGRRPRPPLVHPAGGAHLPGGGRPGVRPIEVDLPQSRGEGLRAPPPRRPRGRAAGRPGQRDLHRTTAHVVVLASQQGAARRPRRGPTSARGAPTTVYLRSAFRGLSGAQGVARGDLMDEGCSPSPSASCTGTASARCRVRSPRTASATPRATR